MNAGAESASAGGDGTPPKWTVEEPAGSPELLMGAAFVGGLVLARLLRRIRE